MLNIKKIYAYYTDSFRGLSREIWIFSLVMFINRAGAMVLPFMTIYVNKDLGYSLTEAGWVMGAYGVGSIIGAYMGGLWTDKWGHYHIQFISLLVSAFFLFIIVWVNDLYLLIVIVFLFAFAVDMLRPANSVAIAVYSTPDNRTRSFSLMRFAVNLGFSVGPALGGLIAWTLGYKWIFIVDCCTSLLALYILVKYLGYTTSLPSEKKEAISHGNVSPSAYTDRTYLLFVVMVSLYAIAFFQLFTSSPAFWENEWRYSEGLIGGLLALNGLIVVIFEMPLIKYLENFQRPMLLVSLGAVLMAIGFIGHLASLPSLFYAVFFIIFMSFSEIFAMPFMTNYAVSRPNPDRRGQYMALYSIAYSIALIGAPVISLTLADVYGFSTVYTMFIGWSLLVAVVFYTLRRKHKIIHLA